MVVPTRRCSHRLVGAPGFVSNRGMSLAPHMPAASDDSVAIDHRLTELEIKASYADDLLDVLNAQVARQQEQIELLLREVGRLRQQGDGSAREATPTNAHDELPPHY